MPFDVNALTQSLDDCFKESGVQDLRNFIGIHPTANKWIIASDFNTDTADTVQDVYAFSCYPMEMGIENLREKIKEILPRDFKDTGKITAEQKVFFRSRRCFCFVFIINRETKFLRTGDQAADLANVRNIIDFTIKQLEENGTGQSYLDHLRRLKQNALRRSFPVYLFERVALLSLLNAYVSWKIAANTKVDLISCFPDRDKMTEFADGLFHPFSYINFHSYWQTIFSLDKLPEMKYPDHRSKDPALLELRDEFIRVPDFLSAVLAKWDLRKNRIVRPELATEKTMIRYIEIIKHWYANNGDMWISNTRMQDGGYITGRQVITRKVGARTRRLSSTKRR